MDTYELGYFSEENSADVVIERNKNAKDERLKEVMESIVRHMHAAVKEIQPTQEEWFEAIMFLTRTGHKCDDWRQEFVLLSDTLGVSMLVDAINSRRPDGASENTVLGPFHIEGSPELEMGANINLDSKGEPMFVHGRILDIHGNRIEGAELDVWQANDEGFYDVQQKGIQPDFNLRGKFKTGPDGRYFFIGAKPKFYPIPADGPVGQLMDMLGRQTFRPAHFHYIITKDGYDTLTTHIFDPDDPYIKSDAVFGVKESLMAKFEPIEDPERAAAVGLEGKYYDVEHDFVLAPAK